MTEDQMWWNAFWWTFFFIGGSIFIGCMIYKANIKDDGRKH